MSVVVLVFVLLDPLARRHSGGSRLGPPMDLVSFRHLSLTTTTKWLTHLLRPTILTDDVVLRVPNEAVYQVGQLDYVKVVQDSGEVETRLIQLGELGRVRTGLKQGDVVLLNPRSL